MSEKTEKKRLLILEAATRVFAMKGYRSVTMKDLVDAAEISRGGLYLYFSSVEEAFLAALELKDQSYEEDLNQEELTKASNTEMLLYFFKTQKKQIINRKSNLLQAKLEYGMACKQEGKTSILKKEMEAERLILQKILERGNDSGEFNCLNPKMEANNIMFALEGMKLTAVMSGISEKKIDEECFYLMQGFILED